MMSVCEEATHEITSTYSAKQSVLVVNARPFSSIDDAANTSGALQLNVSGNRNGRFISLPLKSVSPNRLCSPVVVLSSKSYCIVIACICTTNNEHINVQQYTYERGCNTYRYFAFIHCKAF
jgi:hypothetical protein